MDTATLFHVSAATCDWQEISSIQLQDNETAEDMLRRAVGNAVAYIFRFDATAKIEIAKSYETEHEFGKTLNTQVLVQHYTKSPCVRTKWKVAYRISVPDGLGCYYIVHN